MQPFFNLRVGTTCGCALSLLPNVLSEDIVRTAILAVVGTTVSFTLSLFLKWISGRKEK